MVCPLLNIEMTGGKKTMEKQSRRSVPSWIWDFAGQHRPQYVLSVLSAVCGVVCGILPYFVMAGIISDLLGGCRDMSIYIKNCLVLAVLWLGRCGFHSISTTLSHKATFAVPGTIRKRVCAKLSRVPLGTVLDIPSGSIKNVLVVAYRQHRNGRIWHISYRSLHPICWWLSLFWCICLFWIGGWRWRYWQRFRLVLAAMPS